MKKRWTKIRAWWLRKINGRILVKYHLDPEPSLFFSIVKTEGAITQQYIYVGNGCLLPTSRDRKANNFLMISL